MANKAGSAFWTSAGRTAAAAPLVLAAMLVPGRASASFLSGEAMDTAANVLAWIVLVVVPVIGIVLFWIVHVMPEKIAHKSHHPQRQAIQTLCLLSLVFGGLLWPIAWLWAYTKPVGYKLAYGTEKHEDYFVEHEEQVRAGKVSPEKLAELRQELEAIEQRGVLPPSLRRLRERILAAEAANGGAPTNASALPSRSA